MIGISKKIKNDFYIQFLYLQTVVTQYFVNNKSEIWS